MQGQVYKISCKMGENLGRPAYPRPVGLAAPQNATSLIQGEENTLQLILSRAFEVGLIQ
jgi:hypothetical protein